MATTPDFSDAKARAARFSRWLGVRVVEGVAIRIVAGVFVVGVVVAAALFLWELSLVTEGIRGDRMTDPDARAWLQVWLLSGVGRFLALAIAVVAGAIGLWEWMRHRKSMSR